MAKKPTPKIKADPGAITLDGPLQPLVSAKDLASHLSVSGRTVKRLVQAKQLPGVLIGGQWRFDVLAVRKSIAERIKAAPGSVPRAPRGGTAPGKPLRQRRRAPKDSA